MPVALRPRLRPIEAIIVQDGDGGRVLMLRDTEGVAERPVLVPEQLVPVVTRFDGRRTIDEIARDASRATGGSVDPHIVERLVRELDQAFMLDTPAFRARRIECVRAFERLAVRPAWHAGGAYHEGPDELAAFIEDECFGKASPRVRRRPIIGLCAPHMDLWRAAEGYGHAYAALGAALDPSIDTFVLLGTCHAPMRMPFAVCEKAFDTPLGKLEPDREAIAALAEGARFDVREEEYLHRSEHSLEFQAVFLRHVLDGRPATIVPILCGLGDAQAARRDPSTDAFAESFVRALADVVEHRRGRVAVIAGADLAHVGPRFGDPKPFGEGSRKALEQRDLATVGYAGERDAPGFFGHAVEDLASRRICGVGPIYTMLRVLPREARGELLHYAQSIDDDGSIVSYASMAFSG